MLSDKSLLQQWPQQRRMMPLRSPVDISCFCWSLACLIDFTVALQEAQTKLNGLKDKRRKEGRDLKQQIATLEEQLRTGMI